MIVVKKLAAELQIKLVVKLFDPFFDFGRLHLHVFFVVESQSFHSLYPLKTQFHIISERDRECH